MRIKVMLPVSEFETWTEEATQSLVGQSPSYVVGPGGLQSSYTVVAARLIDGKPLLTLEVPDDDNLFSHASDYSIDE